MTGIQFVTDENGGKVGILIDLKTTPPPLGRWDGFVSESRRKEKRIPYEQYRAAHARARHIASVHDRLRQLVLPCLDRLLRNLLPQRNRVKRLVLR
jgi:hypothetical protein